MNLDERIKNGKRDINKIRKFVGLPKLKSGQIRCLKCEGYFYSIDKVNNRICKKCGGHQYGKGTYSLRLHTR